MKYSEAKTVVNRVKRIERDLRQAQNRRAVIEEHFGELQIEVDAQSIITEQQRIIEEHEKSILAFKEGIERSEAEIERQTREIELAQERIVEGREALDTVDFEISNLKGRLTTYSNKIEQARERVAEHKSKAEKHALRVHAAKLGVEITEASNALAPEVRVRDGVEIPGTEDKIVEANANLSTGELPSQEAS